MTNDQNRVCDIIQIEAKKFESYSFKLPSNRESFAINLVEAISKEIIFIPKGLPRSEVEKSMRDQYKFSESGINEHYQEKK